MATVIAAAVRRSGATARRSGQRLAVGSVVTALAVLPLVAVPGVDAATSASTVRGEGTALPQHAEEGKIAFVREDAIYTMDADGSGQSRLVGPADAEEERYEAPAWSPD